MRLVDTAATDRFTTADLAVAVVRPGDRVFVGTACATPRALVSALEHRALDVPGVQLVHFLTDGVTVDFGKGPTSLFHHRVTFVGRDVRDLPPSMVDYVPISLADVPALFSSRQQPLDVAFVQVAPPDDDGMCSLGVSVDVTLAAVRAARIVVAEVNPAMPRTHGESLVPVGRFAHLVMVDTPVIEFDHEPLGPVGRQIARYVARLVGDGATLQIGLGQVPNEMLHLLTNRRDLGIHSDVITEPLVDLIEAGAVTGSRKGIHPHRVVASYAMGTRRLYDLLDDNVRFELRPIEYVCDPGVIARNTAMVSVTQALAVDLTGQVCADWLGNAPYAGVSTQPDFHHGARQSPGGKAVVCLASTHPDGSSAIKLGLSPGEAVAIPRADVHWLVTEYGTAYLHGRSLRERAMALLEVAHPDHRERLLAEAAATGLVPATARLRSRSAYPVEEESRHVLRDGAEVLLRPTRSTDAPAMQELFFRLTPEDVYTRFFRRLSSLTLEKAEHLCSVSYEHEMAFAAVIGEGGTERVIGTGCYYVEADTGLADVAYMVDPAWQGRGVGQLLQARLTDYARRHGVRGFTADVLAHNEAMLSVMRRSGCDMSVRPSNGEIEVTLLF